MAQERYYNFGGTATDIAENLIHSTLHDAGVYEGMVLSAVDVGSSVLVEISPGAGMLPNGIIWRETSTLSLTPTVPSDPTNYSIVATHESRQLLGGVPVEYEIREGIFKDGDLVSEGGVVLGWIYHPGGSVIGTITDDMLETADKKKPSVNLTALFETSPIELLPPLSRSAITIPDPITNDKIVIHESAFDDSEYVVYQGVENEGPTSSPPTQLAVQNFSFYYNGYRPSSINLYTKFGPALSTQMNLEVHLFDTSQHPVSITGGDVDDYKITGTGAWKDSTLSVDRTDGTYEGGTAYEFELGKPYTIRLIHNVYQGTTLRLGRMVVNFWPYPTS